MNTLLILLGEEFQIFSFMSIVILLIGRAIIGVIRMVKYKKFYAKEFLLLIGIFICFSVVGLFPGYPLSLRVISHDFFSLANSYMAKFSDRKNGFSNKDFPRWILNVDGAGGVVHYPENQKRSIETSCVFIWMRYDNTIRYARRIKVADELFITRIALFSVQDGKLPYYVEIGVEDYDKLNFAIEKSDHQTAQKLIDSLPVAVLSQADYDGITPLMRAVSMDNVTVVEALLNKKVAISIENIFFDNLYEIAQRRNNEQIIRLLTQGDYKSLN